MCVCVCVCVCVCACVCVLLLKIVYTITCPVDTGADNDAYMIRSEFSMSLFSSCVCEWVGAYVRAYVIKIFRLQSN